MSYAPWFIIYINGVCNGGVCVIPYTPVLSSHQVMSANTSSGDARTTNTVTGSRKARMYTDWETSNTQNKPNYRIPKDTVGMYFWGSV